MALNLYTFHGLAHLLHVAWPTAQHIIWNIECDSQAIVMKFTRLWEGDYRTNWLENSFKIGMIVEI